MEQAVAIERPDLVTLTVTDWDRTRRAHLEDVPSSATVAEVLDEVRRVMELAPETSYQLVLDGRQLNQMEMLSEAGVGSGSVMEILPEVHAG